VVGAPFYFDRESGGSVYVYINENYSIKPKFDIKLMGKSESRFGFSISSAGDLNKDGCDDLVIGSPYEGNGVVYLYLGNRKTGLDKEPKQIIRSEMLPDMDKNNYPDLLIGAYEHVIRLISFENFLHLIIVVFF
jgi:integrin alpha 7